MKMLPKLSQLVLRIVSQEEQTECSPRPVRSAAATSSSRCPPAETVSYAAGPDAGPCVAVAPAGSGLVVAADTPPRSARQRENAIVRRVAIVATRSRFSGQMRRRVRVHITAERKCAELKLMSDDT